jgi:hypothetical protein
VARIVTDVAAMIAITSPCFFMSGKNTGMKKTFCMKSFQ